MKLLTVFLFLPLYLFCQANRFVFEYRYVKDTIKNDTIKAIMHLDTYKTGSIFYDVQNYKNDSIASMQGERLSNFENRIYKEYPNYDIFLITSLNNEFYKVSDTRKMDWQISLEKKEINKFKVQKATLNFGGRTWTAWFSTDIPISDGPYKFHGLPGFIVRIEDNTLTHIFELIAIQKTNDTLSYKTPNQKLISINQKVYRKLFNEYRENPNKNMLGIDILQTQDGKSSAEFKRNMEKYYKNRLKKDNNILEIDLLKK